MSANCRSRSCGSLGIEVLVVPEAAIEQGIGLLAEGAKLVAEGAGAAALAAVLHFPDRFAGRRVGLPVCGGNIDARILANTLQRNLLRDGRMLRLVMEMPDRPGMLGDIATRIGNEGGNILEVAHHRLFSSPTVQAAQLEVMIEARDAAHGSLHRIEAARGLYRAQVVRLTFRSPAALSRGSTRWGAQMLSGRLAGSMRGSSPRMTKESGQHCCLTTPVTGHLRSGRLPHI